MTEIFPSLELLKDERKKSYNINNCSSFVFPRSRNIYTHTHTHTHTHKKKKKSSFTCSISVLSNGKEC